MSDVIQLLPDTVANQIAAGEVIQRPASVIKELVENAIDAGATKIKVVVVDAGRTSIQVIDDGKGMSETDARMSFERHATSKIRKADDLFALHTMGFRGEALASIAAVAQVDLTTRQASDEVGTHLSIAASKITGQEPVSCPVGSNFKVENLFYNVPARRKFLKSNTTELSQIMAAFERIVLVYPSIAFSIYSNGTEMLALRPGSLRQRIVDVFGKRLNQDLLPVDVDTALARIHGFVGRPESARKKGQHQYFFVNGRYMKHPLFHKAVMAPYERLIPVGMQVPYFIYFDVNPADIDVNIHPTKTEIKFENEQSVFQVLQASVKDAIGKFCEVPSIDFNTDGRPDIPIFDPSAHLDTPQTDFNPSYNPFTATPSSPSSSAGGAPAMPAGSFGGASSEAGSMPSGVGGESPFGINPPAGGNGMTDDIFLSQDEPQQPVPSDELPHDDVNLIDGKSPTHYQYKGRYIMTAVKSGLMIIDQQRADMRIKYEHYLAVFANSAIDTQRVLFPEVVQFAPSDSVALQKLLPELARMGFELSDLGQNSYGINGVPAGLDNINYPALLQEMVSEAVEGSHTGNLDDMHRSLALTLARRSAIAPDTQLDNDQMESIVNELFACTNVNYTPDGKAIICILPQRDIEQLLG